MNVGFVGWRGMVGSVLMERMWEERDFKYISDRFFFSTSDVGGKAPAEVGGQRLEDANSVVSLKKCDVIVTCQGGAWTTEIYPKLRNQGWKGIWLDAASTLRMQEDSIIVLDPINRGIIDKGLKMGIKTFVGGNCTVSLMLMACHGLFEENLVEWVNTDTYQAASGAGAKHMQELVRQMAVVGKECNPELAALVLDKKLSECLRSPDFPIENFSVPLAGSLIPWIDRAFQDGQTKEEWKGDAEANKILGTGVHIPVGGICVRVGSMRCHSQALLIKLNKDIPLGDICSIINEANSWVKVVPNEERETVTQLTPADVSGGLVVAIGRIHKANIGPQYIRAFTVGDQLLWGAAEPIRRTLQIILETM